MLTSHGALSQDIGPGLFTQSISMGPARTVLGSTQWIPPFGSVAASITGPGALTFNPALGLPGPIEVRTQSAIAFLIKASGQLEINPGAAPYLTTITTTGDNASAIDLLQGSHLLRLNNVSITTFGTNSDGIRIENPNNDILASNASITAAGVGSSALAFINTGGGVETFTNSTLQSDAGPVIRVATTNNKTINLNDTRVIAGANDGRWLSVAGIATINTSNAQLTGAAVTTSGTSNVTLGNATVWDMTGSSNVTNLTNNGSIIAFAPPVGGLFKTLTTGTYSGNGGTIGLNSFLGADSSPSDLLIINGGTATGNSFLKITPTAGSPGAYTTGNGILVVSAGNGGTTAAGAFTLYGEARAGFIDYRLYRGGADGSNPNDWFLRSGFNGSNGNGNGNGNGDPGNGPVTPPGVLPPFPAPDHGLPPPPGIWPIIGPELATYGVVQPIARQMGLATLGTMHERIGDAATDTACLNADATRKQPVPEERCRPALWGRLFGQQIDNRYRAFADPRANGHVAGVQTGIDVWRGSLIPGHSETTGLYFAYGNSNVSVDGLVTNAAATAYILQRTGSLRLDAYSFGGYWTHHGPGGWYVDAVVQGSIYNGNARTQFADLRTNGTGFISSLEAGYPIHLPWLGPRFVLEPQAQIIWQQISFDSANDGLGRVSLGTTSGSSARIGLRAKWSIEDSAGRLWQPYLLANLWRDWGAEVNTRFGSDSVFLSEQATRLELGGGISAKLMPGLRLYAQAGYQFAVNDTIDGRRDGIKGNFGVHYTW